MTELLTPVKGIGFVDSGGNLTDHGFIVLDKNFRTLSDQSGLVNVADTQSISGAKTFTAPMIADDVTVGGTLQVADTATFLGHIDSADTIFARTLLTHTLVSTTALQPLFGVEISPNGAVSVQPGLYQYYMYMTINAMSATSGNAQIGIAAGTATIAGIRTITRGGDGAAPPFAGSWSQAQSELSTTSAAVAGTGTSLVIEVQGWFVVTAAGTIIPSISLNTAAAAEIATNAIFWAHRVSNSTGLSKGSWT